MKFFPRTFSFFVLLLAMPTASWQWMFKPQDNTIRDVRKPTAEKKQKLQDVAAKMASTKDIAGEVNELKKALEFCESKLPTEKEYNKVFDEMKITADDRVPGEAVVEMVLTIHFDAARKVAGAQ